MSITTDASNASHQTSELSIMTDFAVSRLSDDDLDTVQGGLSGAGIGGIAGGTLGVVGVGALAVGSGIVAVVSAPVLISAAVVGVVGAGVGAGVGKVVDLVRGA